MKLTAASVIFRGRVRRTEGFTPAGTTAETKRPLIMTTRNILWQTIWHTKSRCHMLSIRSVTRDGRAVGVPGKRRHAHTNRSSRACASGTACVHPACDRGSGRYGDYVGIACANQSAYVAWASAKHPSDLPNTAGLNVYFARIDPVLRPPEPAACKACRDERNSCLQDAQHSSEIHACVGEYTHCRRIN